jgi:hypothetical protein
MAAKHPNVAAAAGQAFSRVFQESFDPPKAAANFWIKVVFRSFEKDIRKGMRRQTVFYIILPT